MKSRCLFLIVVLMIPVGVAAVPKAEHHHTGIYLRLSTGLGFSYSREEVESIDYQIYGFANMVFLSIDGALTENLILSADVFGSVTVDSTVHVSYLPDLGGSGTVDVSGELACFGTGAGITYYVMPINLYFGLSGGISKVTFTDTSGYEISTKIGWGVNLMVGKEWWVSENWGLGIALQMFLASSPEKNIAAEIVTTAGGLPFSATFN
jgi:hypothetical protein